MMQKKLFILLSAAFLFFFSFIAFSTAAGVNVNEGKWEITTKMSMPGMPDNMAHQTFTHTQCITNDNYVPRGSQSGRSGGCELVDVTVSGNTVSWRIECDSTQGGMTGEGEVTYYGDSFEGTMNMTTPAGEMTQEMTGRRMGACD